MHSVQIGRILLFLLGPWAQGTVTRGPHFHSQQAQNGWGADSTKDRQRWESWDPFLTASHPFNIDLPLRVLCVRCVTESQQSCKAATLRTSVEAAQGGSERSFM